MFSVKATSMFSESITLLITQEGSGWCGFVAEETKAAWSDELNDLE